MRYEILFYETHAEITTSGDADVECIKRMTEEVVGHPAFHPDIRILLDQSRLNFKPIYSFSKVASIAYMQVKHKDKARDIKLATVRPRDADPAYLDIWNSVCGYFGLRFRIKRFHDRGEALGWLLSDRDG